MAPTLGNRLVLPQFDRAFFGTGQNLSAIGTGQLGGKGTGLCFMDDVLRTRLPDGRVGEFRIEVPRLVVLGTDVFDRFLSLNSLGEVLDADPRDEDLALAFQRAEFPPEFVGDLRALVEEVRVPLAVRSSSLLEDALAHPFAGVYGTKMTPNHQPDADTRFRRLVEAIKFVYASTYFSRARRYRARSGQPEKAEKMAVILQQIVGRRHLDRFYPDVSGVARSWNYYRYGPSRPDDGVVVLALGLGKTIVDGGAAWWYSPRLPAVAPPFGSTQDLLQGTQQRFWAVRMDQRRVYDPTAETEYLAHAELADAEFDGTLAHVASTYDVAADRLVPGIGRTGPRAVTFAPLLQLETFRLNEALTALLRLCEDATGGAVEIEVAATLDPRSDPPGHLGFLQVRPMTVPSEIVEVDEHELTATNVVVASTNALGNVRDHDIRDIVFVRPEIFDASLTRAIAAELESLNQPLAAAGSPYLLIGIGRWGSADPWLGIPVEWSQISGARVIVEAQMPALAPDPSQGSHFFHNLAAFGIAYLCVPLPGIVDWDWLATQPACAETTHVRHIRLEFPLTVKVDGRSGRGVVLR